MDIMLSGCSNQSKWDVECLVLRLKKKKKGGFSFWKDGIVVKTYPTHDSTFAETQEQFALMQWQLKQCRRWSPLHPLFSSCQSTTMTTSWLVLWLYTGSFRLACEFLSLVQWLSRFTLYIVHLLCLNGVREERRILFL